MSDQRYPVTIFDWRWDWLVLVFVAVFLSLIIRGSFVVQFVLVALLIIWIVSEIVMRLKPPFVELGADSMRLLIGPGPTRETRYSNIVGVSVTKTAPSGLGLFALVFRLPGFPRIYYPSVTILLREPLGGFTFAPILMPLVGTTMRIQVSEAESLASDLRQRISANAV